MKFLDLKDLIFGKRIVDLTLEDTEWARAFGTVLYLPPLRHPAATGLHRTLTENLKALNRK